ncbi:MAG TPA: hypothetical protein K8V14_08950 [Staphylococcus ureilyticus]|uniref:hypothetical protein n=1 Tax=Staphylococcus ureilyticus TaxID=94138 RepID=UPI001DB9DA34|nr:hypothetical protein [Staphylococcus ureilyticus]HJG67428.1 hypothetical protein [Staphylococcus ureilyticus]
MNSYIIFLSKNIKVIYLKEPQNNTSLIISILSLIISLVVPLITIWLSIQKEKRENARVKMDYDKETRWVYAMVDRRNFTPIPDTPQGLWNFNIRILNTSDKDIGFFDFLIQDKNNNQIDYYSKLQLPVNTQVDTILVNPSEKLVEFPIQLPAEHGVFLAHQETNLSVVIKSNYDINDLCFSFKVARELEIWERIYNYFHHRSFGATMDIYCGKVKVNSNNKPDYNKMKQDFDRYYSQG